jgi:signal transduction histidine kinase
VVFSIGSIILYNIFLNEIKHETDLYLVERFLTTLNLLESHDQISPINGFKLKIDTLDYKPDKVGRPSHTFSDTMVMHEYLKRMENNRKMTGIEEVNGAYIKITLWDVIVETDDIMDGVFNSLWRLFLFLGVVMMISSFLISRNILKPFNSTLEKIRTFNIKDLKPLRLKKSHTREFNLLNEFIENMTEKVSNDYKSLKEFSENASHEIQTPIAIAKGKLELMLQSNELSENQMQHIESAYQSLDHISKLSRSLTLLTKIENQEFSNFKEHNFSDMLKKALRDFTELFDLKNIQLDTEIKENVTLNNNDDLLQILINNLLNNALRHNIEGGKIKIILTNREFIIRNTGDPLKTPPDELFNRFKKDNQTDVSLGLGLAIVKKIIDISEYSINYSFDNNLHTMSITF